MNGPRKSLIEKVNIHKQLLKDNLKTFTVLFSLSLISCCLASLMFFYIEHCAYSSSNSSSINNNNNNNITHSNNNNSNVNEGTANSKNVRLSKCSSAYEEELTCDLNRYTFGKWFDYVTSIAYTVGFGRVVTKTTLGKFVTILFTIPAITFNMSVYISAGKLLTSTTKLVILFIESYFFGRKATKHLTAKMIVINMIKTILLWLIYSWLCINSSNFGPNGISYGDALYFGFITITTIGFGDISYSSEVASREFYIFFFHSLVFVFATGAIASVITELNNIGASKTIKNKLLCCYRCRHHKVNKDDRRHDSRNSRQSQKSNSPENQEFLMNDSRDKVTNKTFMDCATQT